MASDNLRSGFQRGAMAMIILSLLKYRDMYGYQLSKEMERRSEDAFQIKEGTLYPALKKLEEKSNKQAALKELIKSLKDLEFEIQKIDLSLSQN